MEIQGQILRQEQRPDQDQRRNPEQRPNQEQRPDQEQGTEPDLTKQQLRRIVAQRRRSYGREALAGMSAEITQQVLKLDVYQRSSCVFAYMELPGEVMMHGLILRCLQDGKRVALPRTEGKEMHFYEIGMPAGVREKAEEDRILFAQLIPGAMGILEPDPEICPGMDGEEDALIIMPGVAFDRNRNRVGYGGGYYDRYLSLHRDHPTVAVAYGFQIFDEVPHADTDIRPQLLIRSAL